MKSLLALDAAFNALTGKPEGVPVRKLGDLLGGVNAAMGRASTRMAVALAGMLSRLRDAREPQVAPEEESDVEAPAGTGADAASRYTAPGVNAAYNPTYFSASGMPIWSL